MTHIVPTAGNVRLTFSDGETLEGYIDLNVGYAALIGRDLIQAAEKARIMKVRALEDKLEFFKQIETGVSDDS